MSIQAETVIFLEMTLYRRQLDLFQCLQDFSPLIQEATSVLTHWRGVGKLFQLCVGVSLQSCVGVSLQSR